MDLFIKATSDHRDEIFTTLLKEEYLNFLDMMKDGYDDYLNQDKKTIEAFKNLLRYYLPPSEYANLDSYVHSSTLYGVTHAG
jgi:aspartate/tyrosine/aromatic aminotransferase